MAAKVSTAVYDVMRASFQPERKCFCWLLSTLWCLLLLLRCSFVLASSCVGTQLSWHFWHGSFRSWRFRHGNFWRWSFWWSAVLSALELLAVSAFGVGAFGVVVFRVGSLAWELSALGLSACELWRGNVWRSVLSAWELLVVGAFGSRCFRLWRFRSASFLSRCCRRAR